MPTLHQETIAVAQQLAVRSRYNATRNVTSRTLHDQGVSISPGLAKRLANYARKRLTEGGFGTLIADWEVHVEGWSIYGDKPEDQTYVVTFKNTEGGSIGIEGIQIYRGWPTLDHGPCIEI